MQAFTALLHLVLFLFCSAFMCIQFFWRSLLVFCLCFLLHNYTPPRTNVGRPQGWNRRCPISHLPLAMQGRTSVSVVPYRSRSQCLRTEQCFSSFNIFQGHESPPVSKYIACCIGCIVNSVFWSQFRIGKNELFWWSCLTCSTQTQISSFSWINVLRMAESEEYSALGSQELVPGASAGGIGAPMRPPSDVHIVYAVSNFNISGIFQRVQSHSGTRLRPSANSFLR